MKHLFSRWLLNEISLRIGILMDTVSWRGTVHLSESAFKLPQFYKSFLFLLQVMWESSEWKGSVWNINHMRIFVSLCQWNRNIGTFCMKPQPLGMWNSYLKWEYQCGMRQEGSTDAKHLHISFNLWASWWWPSHGLRTVRSRISWWVWYEPLGKEERSGEEGGGGHSRFPARLIGESLLLTCLRSSSALRQQGALWLAHLVSAGRGRGGGGGVKLRKLVWESEVSASLSLQPGSLSPQFKQINNELQIMAWTRAFLTCNVWCILVTNQPFAAFNSDLQK